VPTQQSDEMLAALKKAAAVLRDHDIPFAVGGGIAVWARGGPATEHDVDLVIRPGDVDAALAALGEEGMRTERPPEGWLVKAWEGDVLIDLVFEPAGFIVDDEVLARCEERNVQAVPMMLLPSEDIMVSKLLSLTEHYLAYEPLLEHARALREQVDWDVVRRRTEASPFARAFFTLVEELGIVEPAVEGASRA
jgi:hypothetical protein